MQTREIEQEKKNPKIDTAQMKIWYKNGISSYYMENGLYSKWYWQLGTNLEKKNKIRYIPYSIHKNKLL